MSLKPICVKCQRFYRPKENGYMFIEGMPICNGAAAGLAEPENWKPYKLWRGDLWECPGCNNPIIVGTGQAPIDEHYTRTFARNKLAIEVGLQKSLLQINDC